MSIETYLGIIGPLISAFIDIFLVNHFFDHNYRRRYRNQKVYRLILFLIMIGMAVINSFHTLALNMSVWIIVFLVFGLVLFYDEEGGKLHIVFKGLLLFAANNLIELLSYFILIFIVNSMHAIVISTAIYSFLNLTVTKILNIILYFSVIKYLLGKDKLKRLSHWHYITYFFLAMISFLGTFLVINSIEHVVGGWRALIVISYLILIVLLNLFTMSLLDSLAENMELKIQLGIFEQQEILQERYYGSLDERYNQSLKVLHDVDRHIRVIEGLYQEGQNTEAMEYTREISRMLLPLVPRRFTSNDILNIILNDKAEAAGKNHIEFKCDIEEFDYGFLKNSDITTIFSNLLDNAIEACMKLESGRYIRIHTSSQLSILLIEIRNATGEIPVWEAGRPLSQKPGNHGIGLKNVEKVVLNYEGSIDYRMEGEEFICSVILNKPH